MNLDLDIKKWKEFSVEYIFEVRGTKTTKVSELEIYGYGPYPYVTTQATNNGVAGFYNHFTEFGNVLTIDSAVAGFCSYQEHNFSASDHVEKLVPKFNMNKYHAYFFVTLLNREQYKYSYGRKANQTKIKKTLLKLPIDDNGEIDYNWIEIYIKTLQYKPITTNIISAPNELNIDSWKEFLLDDLFLIKKGKRLIKADMINGAVNFIGAISENNGVRQKIDTSYFWENNCITVNYNGSVGEAFYQNEPFWASDDVNILYPKGWELNKYIAMFIITVIRKNKYKYSYGRKWTLDKMKKSAIKLPVDSRGNPNYLFMEKYIKKLPYSDRI